MKPILFAPLLALSILACERVGADAKKPESVPDLWERRRQCAAAIDGVIKHTGWMQANGGTSMSTATSHYNEASQRCYVRIDVLNSHPDPKIGIPFTTYYVYDAFDAGIGVVCSDENRAEPAAFCSIERPGAEPSLGCAKCRAVATDLMTK